MAKMILEVSIMSKQQLQEAVGNEFERQFKKNPLIKKFFKVSYE